MTDMTNVFVFGSNLAGRHGAGSALAAKLHHGAVYGIGVGHVGNSYAIPTKDGSFNVLSIATIKKYVDDFIQYAKDHPELTFDIVKIGCGLAGFKDHEIAPLFKGAPINCNLPSDWHDIIVD